MKTKKNKLKIIFVTPYFPPKMGGVENYVYNIAKGLKKEYGWDVVVITSNHVERKKKIEIIDGIKIYRLPRWFKISNTPINPLWYFDIKKIIKLEKPDIVNAHAPVPFIADVVTMGLDKTLFVLTYHSGTMKKNKIFSDIMISFYENLILPLLAKRANKIICSSDFVKKTIMMPYHSKTITVHPGVDTSLFKPNSSMKRNKNVVLFICRYKNMHKMKGLHNLADAMKELPFAKLRIIGEEGNIEGKNIECLGIKSGKSLAKEIQLSNVLILPSLANMESFGMVLLEAMACKIPVIGTKIGGIPEVISHERDGLIVPPQDPKTLAKAIKKILTNKKLAKSMGEKGYKKIKEKYLWKYKIAETEMIFNELTSQL